MLWIDLKKTKPFLNYLLLLKKPDKVIWYYWENGIDHSYIQDNYDYWMGLRDLTNDSIISEYLKDVKKDKVWWYKDDIERFKPADQFFPAIVAGDKGILGFAFAPDSLNPFGHYVINKPDSDRILPRDVLWYFPLSQIIGDNFREMTFDDK